MPKLTLAQYETFKKFMDRATSEHDGEALTALRMANAVIAKQGITWRQLLDKLVTLDVEDGSRYEASERSADLSPAQKIDFVNAAFRKAENTVNPHSKFYQHIQNLKGKWTTQHFLSEREIQVVVDAGIPWAEKQRRASQ